VEVWSWPGQPQVFLDVSFHRDGKCRVSRQVIGPEGETETLWTLTPNQYDQLRASLGALATSDGLAPADPGSRYDRVVVDALEHLSPPPAPFTYDSNDPSDAGARPREFTSTERHGLS
jgi:hypothetical protein